MPPRKTKPAVDPKARENQLIGLTIDLVEKQLREGTAPASTVNHFLKLATEREKLERQKMERELELLSAKTDSIESNKRTEETYKEAIDAMQRYGGRKE